jgi:hypothetical protein
MMTQSELISKLNEAANTIARGSVRGSANILFSEQLSKQWYNYFNNTKSEMRMEKINRILKWIKEKS